jgi:hypothetical protein
VALDPVSQAEDQKLQELYVDKQEELYSIWDHGGAGGLDPEMAGGDYGDLFEELYGGMGDMEDMGMGQRPRRSSLRRGRGSR